MKKKPSKDQDRNSWSYADEPLGKVLLRIFLASLGVALSIQVSKVFFGPMFPPNVREIAITVIALVLSLLCFRVVLGPHRKKDG